MILAHHVAVVVGAVLGLVTHAALGQGPPRLAGEGSTVYTFSSRTVLEVHVGKSGLLSGFGHEHRIRAHVFTGEIVYFPMAMGRSRVVVTIPTDSLRVVPAADSADIPKITQTMRQETLKVDSFPEITFVSRDLAVAAADSGTVHRVRVTGDLSIVGKTQLVTMDMDIAFAGDTLRADGGFVVNQSDFHIKPYSKPLGLVKVKDAVRFELHVVVLAADPSLDDPEGQERIQR